MALLFALSVNLTLTPAILYSVGKELVAAQAALERCFGCTGGSGAAQPDDESTKPADALHSPLMPDAYDDPTSPSSGATGASFAKGTGGTGYKPVVAGGPASMDGSLNGSITDDAPIGLSDADEFARDQAMSDTLWWAVVSHHGLQSACVACESKHQSAAPQL